MEKSRHNIELLGYGSSKFCAAAGAIVGGWEREFSGPERNNGSQGRWQDKRRKRAGDKTGVKIKNSGRQNG